MAASDRRMCTRADRNDDERGGKEEEDRVDEEANRGGVHCVRVIQRAASTRRADGGDAIAARRASPIYERPGRVLRSCGATPSQADAGILTSPPTRPGSPPPLHLLSAAEAQAT